MQNGPFHINEYVFITCEAGNDGAFVNTLCYVDDHMY